MPTARHRKTGPGAQPTPLSRNATLQKKISQIRSSPSRALPSRRLPSCCSRALSADASTTHSARSFLLHSSLAPACSPTTGRSCCSSAAASRSASTACRHRLPLTERVQGVTLTGTHWPLVDASLIQAKPYAVSNVLAADANTIDVHIRQGILGIHLVFESASDTLHCPSKEHGEHRSSCRSLSVCDADEPPRKAQQQTIPQR